MYQHSATPIDSEAFHSAVYDGGIFFFAQLSAMAELIDVTRDFLESSLAPIEPIEIHQHLTPAQLASKLGDIQASFAKSPEVARAWRLLFEQIGLDPKQTARDRLTIRFQPHSDPGSPLPWSRSTATAGFHRDSWGTNLYSQVNWWAPVYPVTAGRTLAIYPHLWNVPIPNTSASFDLKETLRRIREAPQSLGPADMSPQALGSIPSEGSQPVTIDTGDIIAFSAQHAHAAIANHTALTRISLETRTLWIRDYLAGRGAPNIDGCAALKWPGLFRRLSDGIALPQLTGGQSLEAYIRPRRQQDAS